MQDLDFRLKCPCTILISVPSNCGKTTFVIKLLKKQNNLFNTTSNIVFWFYKVYQHAFKELKKEITSFENEMCTMAWLEKKYVQPYSTIIIDELAL